MRREALSYKRTISWYSRDVRIAPCDNAQDNLAKEMQKLGYRTGIIGKWHNMPDKVLPKRNKKAHQANASYEMTKEHEQAIHNYYKAGIAYLSEGFGWDVVDRMEWKFDSKFRLAV